MLNNLILITDIFDNNFTMKNIKFIGNIFHQINVFVRYLTDQ